MAKIRDILIDISIVTAIRTRKCHRNAKHSIAPGEDFLAIRERSGLGSKNYCRQCAPEILGLARTKLAEITAKLL